MKIAIVHPQLKRGGSEARLLWCTEALKRDHQVTLITAEGANLAALNSAYGSKLNKSDAKIIETGFPWWLKKTKGGDALKGAWFQRKMASLVSEHDLVISTYNLVDVAVPTIQFIADFSWDDAERRRLHPEQGLRGFLHGDNSLRRLYLRVVRWLSNSPPASEILRNSDCIVSNSRFSAEILKQRYGIDSRVIYPPVAGEFPCVPWERRKDRFVALGRISPEKELEKAIAIIEVVRQRGYEVELLIIGDWKASAYGRQLHRTAVEKGGWLQFAGDCRGEEKARLLAESRHGIHACTGEAFGIAVAEMIKAGCIPFVPQEGGPGEIVADDRLVYAHADDAVDKIIRALQKTALQEKLIAHLVRRAALFSEKAFMREVAALVALYE